MIKIQKKNFNLEEEIDKIKVNIFIILFFQNHEKEFLL